MEVFSPVAELPNRGGFNLDYVQRNVWLETSGYKSPITKKTGTTICGVAFADGIVLGADTRATSGPIVCDKNCEKIHYIAPNIYCCGAGTSADTENSTAIVSSQMAVHRLSTGRQSRVATAMTLLKQMLFKYQGHVSAALVLGGFDTTGPHLYSVWPHGSTDKAPFVTMGSGSLAAMAVMEGNYSPGMDETQARQLVHAAILAGIFNDLGSGSNVDMVVIRREGVKLLRNVDTPNPRLYHRIRPYEYPKGTTIVIAEKRTKIGEKKEPAPVDVEMKE